MGPLTRPLSHHIPGHNAEQLLGGHLGVLSAPLSDPPQFPTDSLCSCSLVTLTPLPYFFFQPGRLLFSPGFSQFLLALCLHKRAGQFWYSQSLAKQRMAEVAAVQRCHWQRTGRSGQACASPLAYDTKKHVSWYPSSTHVAGQNSTLRQAENWRKRQKRISNNILLACIASIFETKVPVTEHAFQSWKT